MRSKLCRYALVAICNQKSSDSPAVYSRASRALPPVLCGEHRSQSDAISVGQALPYPERKQAGRERGILLSSSPKWQHEGEKAKVSNPLEDINTAMLEVNIRHTSSSCHATGRRSFGIPAQASLRSSAALRV
jgi:hypothetical protein